MKGWYGNKQAHSLASRGIKSNKSYMISKNINFGEELDIIGFKQFSINKDGIGFGSIRYKKINDILIIDHIRINVNNLKRKGYGSMLVEEAIRKTNPKSIRPTDDGYSDEGLKLIEHIAWKYNLKMYDEDGGRIL